MNIYRLGDENGPPRECFQLDVRDDCGFHTGNELGVCTENPVRDDVMKLPKLAE